MKIDKAGTFVLTKAELKALLAHACNDFTRPHAYGVTFNVAKGHAFATDGHRLAVLRPSVSDVTVSDVADRDNAEWDAAPAFIVSRTDCEQALRACSGKKHVIAVSWRATNALVEIRDKASSAVLAAVPSTAVDAFVIPIDGALPSYAYEGPEWSACPCVGVDARYLADLALVQAACVEKNPWTDMIAPPDHLSAFDFRVGEFWRVVLMPLRSDRAERVAKLARERGDARRVA